MTLRVRAGLLAATAVAALLGVAEPAAGDVSAGALPALADGAASLRVQTQAADPGGDDAVHVRRRPFDEIFAFAGAGRINGIVYDLRGAQWHAVFQVPAGAPLAVGSYQVAPQSPPGSGAAMTITGPGIDCDQVSGAFTIHELAFAGGQPSRVRVTFRERCGGSIRRLVGAFDYTPPHLPPLQLTVTLNSHATLTAGGAVTIGGTLACTQFVAASIGVRLQTADQLLVASLTSAPACRPGLVVQWTATGSVDPGAPPPPSDVSGSAIVSARDGNTDTERAAGSGDVAVHLGQSCGGSRADRTGAAVRPLDGG